MKPGSPPPPLPDDEAADPLLAALRQRLGDYGQAPPPGAWAAIRRQVAPAPLPQPWWRRRHPLVLLGLLLLCWLLPGRLGERAAPHGAGLGALVSPPGAFPATGPLAPATALGGRTARRAKTLAVEAERATSPGELAPSYPSATSHERSVHSSQLSDKGNNKTVITSRARAAAAHAMAAPALRQLAGSETITASTPNADAVASAPRRKKPRWAIALAVAPKHRSEYNPLARRRPAARRTPAREYEATVPLATPGARELPAGQLAGGIRRAHRATAAASRATRPQEAASEVSEETLGFAARQLASHSGRPATGELSNAAPTDAAAPTATLAAPLVSNVFPFGPLDSLVLKHPDLRLPAPVALATLVARPDSVPAPPPVRRWALLVLAGPTVSYRTLGPAPTLAAGHPDFARLERPALGLGAQVQVRRVLSGRWALAVGLGYHEYATRLALSLKDSAYASVRQRDTYRLLTVPMQLSYALGAPKSRLSTALLLGAEPGWYLGGRSTEGSGCGCEQQAYTSAASSPYRSLSVAVSLGLDVRYRLGGPGARWQWLVQPAGRYVATPFVRADAVGFTRRQPFSLGLLTGFSWDIR